MSRNCRRRRRHRDQDRLHRLRLRIHPRLHPRHPLHRPQAIQAPQTLHDHHRRVVMTRLDPSIHAIAAITPKRKELDTIHHKKLDFFKKQYTKKGINFFNILLSFFQLIRSSNT